MRFFVLCGDDVHVRCGSFGVPVKDVVECWQIVFVPFAFKQFLESLFDRGLGFCGDLLWLRNPARLGGWR